MRMKDLAADVYTELFPYVVRFLAVPILVVTLLYGLAVQDSQKAGEMYLKFIRVISAPVVYSLTAPLRELPEKMQSIFQQKP